MTGFDRYSANDEDDTPGSRCPKCGKPELRYDKGARAFVCLACRYRDRK